MVERMRRLRMSLASSSPGASGDIARPNYVGPSGNGLVERMKAGESPWDQGCSVKATPVRFQKAVPRTKENAAVERREANALRYWACAARRSTVIPRLSALCSLTSGEHGNAGAPRASREQGRRSFADCPPAV